MEQPDDFGVIVPLNLEEYQKLAAHELEVLERMTYDELLAEFRSKMSKGGSSGEWFTQAFLGFHMRGEIEIRGYMHLGRYDRLLFRRMLELDTCEGFSYTCPKLADLVMWVRERDAPAED